MMYAKRALNKENQPLVGSNSIHLLLMQRYLYL